MGACNCNDELATWAQVNGLYWRANSMYYNALSRAHYQEATVLKDFSLAMAATAAVNVLSGTPLMAKALKTCATLWAKFLLEKNKLEDLKAEANEIMRDMNNLKKEADDAKKPYDACKSTLMTCGKCGGSFKPELSCGLVCKGCGEFYCLNCFIDYIEEHELHYK